MVPGSSNDVIYGSPISAAAPAQHDGIQIGDGAALPSRASIVSGNTVYDSRGHGHHAQRLRPGAQRHRQPCLWQRHRHRRLHRGLGCGEPFNGLPATTSSTIAPASPRVGTCSSRRTRSTANPASASASSRCYEAIGNIVYNNVEGMPTLQQRRVGDREQYRLRQHRRRHGVRATTIAQGNTVYANATGILVSLLQRPGRPVGEQPGL